MDYQERQAAANRDLCDLYVEQHFNSSVGESANYTVVVVGSNASARSKVLGRAYANRIANEFGTRLGGQNGLLIGGFNGRGDGNIRHTKMPAVLLEPLFGSNPAQAKIISSPDGQLRLARCLADTIKEFYADDAKIAFSIGHKYKRTNPRDRGAAVVGGATEADCAEQVLILAAEMLQGKQGYYEVQAGDTLWSIAQSLGTSVEKLREWNGIEGNVIVPGQKLELQ